MNTKKFLLKLSFPKAALEHLENPLLMRSALVAALGHLANSLLMRGALVAAILMPFIRAVHNVQIMVYEGVDGAINLVTKKLELASYKALRAATINSLTRSIFPSVRTWDRNIKKACHSFSGLLETIFAQLALLIFCILVICVPLACAVIAAVVVPIAKFIDDIVCTLAGIDKTNPCCAKPSKTENVKLSAKIRSNVADIVTHTAYAILSLLCIPCIAPVYALASAFNLANKFNIYGYNRDYSGGIVHNRLRDIRNNDVNMTLNDQALFLETLQGHPSMHVKFELVGIDSSKPSSILNSGISVSMTHIVRSATR